MPAQGYDLGVYGEIISKIGVSVFKLLLSVNLNNKPLNLSGGSLCPPAGFQNSQRVDMETCPYFYFTFTVLTALVLL